jgi:hypothetical protein
MVVSMMGLEPRMLLGGASIDLQNVVVAGCCDGCQMGVEGSG